MRKLVTVGVLAAIAWTSSGCFGSDDPSSDAKGSSANSTAPTASQATVTSDLGPLDLTAADARAAVARVYSGTGHFLATSTRSGEDYRQWFGSFSAERQAAVVQYSDRHPNDYDVYTVVRGADVYAATRPDGPLRSCWAHVDPADPPVDGVSPGFPPQVGNLAHLDAVTPAVAGQGAATIPLANALEVVDPVLAASLRPIRGGRPVDVVLGYEAGELTAWSIEPRAASDVARAADVELSKREFSRLSREAVTIEFSDVGKSVSLGFLDDRPRVADGAC